MFPLMESQTLQPKFEPFLLGAIPPELGAAFLIAAPWGIFSPSGAQTVVSSVDGLRLNLHFKPDCDALGECLYHLPCDEPCNRDGEPRGGLEIVSYNNGHPNQYAKTITYRFGNMRGQASCSILLGQIQKDYSIDWSKGVLDFNPNKCGGWPTFTDFCQQLYEMVEHVELAWFDWATDIIGVSTMQMTMLKDLRALDTQTYREYDSISKTQYLGQRSHNGRVKLYDKRQEVKAKTSHWACGTIELDEDVSRIELTIDPRGKNEDDVVLAMRTAWPKIVTVDDSNIRGSGLMKVVCLLLAEKLAEGKTIDSYLKFLNKKTKPKVLGMIATDLILFPQKIARACFQEAKEWQNFALKSREIEQMRPL